jgi:hypothetical protein
MEVNGRVIENDVEIQLDGDRASRVEWLGWTEVSP